VLLEGCGMSVRGFVSAEAFLASLSDVATDGGTS
jgi:hypothetical protein